MPQTSEEKTDSSKTGARLEFETAGAKLVAALMRMMTVMLIGGGGGGGGDVPGPQLPPLIKATGLNGLLVPGVTDSLSHSNLPY